MYIVVLLHVLYVATQLQLQLASHHTAVQTVNTTSDQSVKCKFVYGKNFNNACSNLLANDEKPSIRQVTLITCHIWMDQQLVYA